LAIVGWLTPKIGPLSLGRCLTGLRTRRAAEEALWKDDTTPKKQVYGGKVLTVRNMAD